MEAVTAAENASSLSATVNLQTETGKQIVIGDTVEIFDYQGNRPPIKKIDKSAVLQIVGNKTVFEIPVGDLKPGFATDLFIRFSFIAK